ncbi:hypothetical protein CHS0354_026819 [Potamilus streckersoni]|uniref:Elongation factor Ts, mitochondrial n=1 Tax=Potamilus streckersoni TaxID=2493646 RepID=A0AAE0W6K4_9BIVA|nr:hypothetical protein CHS0354_026819 [Potamilus streckersoni]
MAYSAQSVKELREKTGAGIMDCKKALEEASGDMEAALDWLRKKGQIVAEKKSSREAKEGLIAMYKDSSGKKTGMIRLNCETDFVARNENFTALLNKLGQYLLASDGKDFLNYKTPEGTISEIVSGAISSLGENLILSDYFLHTQGEKSTVGTYIHTNGKIGALVDIASSSGTSGAIEELAKDLSMHISASTVAAIEESAIPAAVLEKERTFLTEQAKESGKPADIIAKMIDGRISKFKKEICLMEQPFIKNPDVTIKQHVVAVGKANNCTLTRILLKLSGEYLGGESGRGFDKQIIENLTDQIIEIHNTGTDVAIVVGGGNIFRGARSAGLDMERVTADQIGMLATVMNGLCLQDALERKDKKVRLMSAIDIPSFAESYIKRRAVRHLEKGRIIIFAAGTGNPYFSTDTAAALRAAEIKAEIIIKGTLVDGIYDKDPNKYDDAVKYDELTYTEVLVKELNVMDSTAISFCRDNKIPLYVLNLKQQSSLYNFLQGEHHGTLVYNAAT